MSNTQAYSITISLPDEHVNHQKDVVENYIKRLKEMKLKYIVSEETGEKNGKIHFHIGYLSLPQKSTSNETKKFKECYEHIFKKSEFENAILHKKHNDWETLVGYVAKDGKVLQNTTELDAGKTALLYKTNKKKYIPKEEDKFFFTTNQVANGIVKWLKNDEDLLKEWDEARAEYEREHMVDNWLESNMDAINYNTYSKIRMETLIKYIKLCLKTTIKKLRFI